MKNNLSIEKLYKDYKNVIYYSILYNIKDKELAEEITNEVFIRFNSMINSFDESVAKPLTYLYHIKKNLIIDHYRKKQLETNSIDSTLVDGVNEPYTQPINSYDSNNLKSKIESAINDLKPNYKIIAQLYFIQEYSHSEISEELCLPINTVKTMIFRTREMLQEKLQEVKKILVN